MFLSTRWFKKTDDTDAGELSKQQHGLHRSWLQSSCSDCIQILLETLSPYGGNRNESSLAVANPGVVFCSISVFKIAIFILINMFNAECRCWSSAVTGLAVMQQYSEKDQRIHTVLSNSAAEIVPHVIIPELRVETSGWRLLLQQKFISPTQSSSGEVNSIHYQWYPFHLKHSHQCLIAKKPLFWVVLKPQLHLYVCKTKPNQNHFAVLHQTFKRGIRKVKSSYSFLEEWAAIDHKICLHITRITQSYMCNSHDRKTKIRVLNEARDHYKSTKDPTWTHIEVCSCLTKQKLWVTFTLFPFIFCLGLRGIVPDSRGM